MNTRLANNTNLSLHNRSTWNNRPVLQQKGGLIINYLERIEQVAQLALAEYPRTFVARVDLRLPDHYEDSSAVSRFIQSLKAQIHADQQYRRRVEKRSHCCRLRYVWARERNQAHQDHYHLLLFFNSDAYNCLGRYDSCNMNLAMRIQKAWASALSLDFQSACNLVHFPRNPGYQLNTASPTFNQAYQAMFERSSYLAKAHTKHYGSGLNSFGSSRG
ncbi:Uncharacterised protein [BD1-7 clade bacterium]|uniref:YagK/YfjJ C-terminal domain-containing protein n=1 Tax=BD1-7 clade bacterium TaxID=2029982 RepID=A0A5S9QTS2_9GAMM|nr:Uncharacterised protein [BD1-7 clade bacterium]CAA0122930.1 Uncharacterised protein [BD1-7 clade bacterium]